ncbi:hypothetical protein WNZ15_15290 [Roseibium sp. AS2]|uniref:hypothetical protein n=1 Tax=Roseibium sp. AS2 TaxID=3135781 RepID=UPI00316BCAC3
MDVLTSFMGQVVAISSLRQICTPVPLHKSGSPQRERGSYRVIAVQQDRTVARARSSSLARMPMLS